MFIVWVNGDPLVKVQSACVQWCVLIFTVDVTFSHMEESNV